MAGARERLASARDQLASGHPETALSTSYYAMLYAARAALSEEDRYSRTHRGTWGLVRELFVLDGRFPADLLKAAQQAQERREDTDYDAKPISMEEAEATLEAADRLVAAVDELYGR